VLKQFQGTKNMVFFTYSFVPCFTSIPVPVSGAFLTPGSGMGKKIRIRDKQPGSYFRELRNNFFGLKY
jgi:hypothetical protein